MTSDAVLAALRKASVPSDAAVDAGIAVPIGPDEYDDIVQAAIATDLDRIGPVAAVHGGPAAKRAMLRTLLEERLEELRLAYLEYGSDYGIAAIVAASDRWNFGDSDDPAFIAALLSLLAPEAPTASADADRKADPDCAACGGAGWYQWTAGGVTTTEDCHCLVPDAPTEDDDG